MALSHKTSETSKDKLTPIEAWPFVKNKICSELFRHDVNIIPSLIDASHYDLFTAATKQNTAKINVLGRRPTYQIIGHLTDIANLEKTDVDRLLDSCKPHYEETDYPVQYEYQGLVEKGGQAYEVRVNFFGLEKFVLNINMEKGDLYLKTAIPQLREAKSLYVVTDVIYAKKITTQVASALYKEQLNVEGPAPVGFTFMKFALREDGLVSEPMKCKVHSDALWEDLIDALEQYANFGKNKKFSKK